jgi:hypothetical protein
MEIKKLKNKYESIVNEIIEIFCKKHECYLEFWVSDNIGGIACFGDVSYFHFSDIYYDVITEQPKNLIFNWRYDSIEYNELGKTINYDSYSRGLRYTDL